MLVDSCVVQIGQGKLLVMVAGALERIVDL